MKMHSATFGLAFLGLTFLLVAPLSMAQEPAQKGDSDLEIAKLIKDLDAEEFQTREKATEKLTEIAGPAIPALAKAIQGQSLEVTSRGMAVLRKLFDSPATKEAAATALEEVAKSSNKSAARRAESILRPEAPQPAAPQNQANPIPRILPGRIQIQAGAIGGNGRRVTTRVVNGQKTIEAEENGKKVKIEEGPGGDIKMEVTETVDGKEKTSKYEAKNADELKKNHAEAHKLYETYSKANPIGRIQIGAIQGNVIPAIPVLPGIPALPDTSKAREKIGQAKAELGKAVEAIKKLDPAKTSPDDIKKLTEQLESAKKQLEEAEKSLDPQ